MSKMYKMFGVNSEKENDGIWIQIDLGDEEKAWRFKLSRQSKQNKEYMKVLEKSIKPYRKALELKILDKKVAERVYKEVFVKSILLDWENVCDEDGQPLDFNFENAMILFEKLPYLYDQLEEDAQNASNFRDEVLKVESKN